MRGTPGRSCRENHRTGIIPAHAGNTAMVERTAAMWWDHPRACGEHVHQAPSSNVERGSSPRMRGTQPARFAGLRYSRDHPRACGEHSAYGAVSVNISGSSPRMRGTLAVLPPPRGDFGIIPAHAGNTYRFCIGCIPRRDHPRACGEHVEGPLRLVVSAGSSPRMRGTPYEPAKYTSWIGIIPAHAGNTTACFS